MVPKHVAFAPRNKWGQAPFCKKEDILRQKMGPVPIYLTFSGLCFGGAFREYLYFSRNLSISTFIPPTKEEMTFTISALQ